MVRFLKNAGLEKQRNEDWNDFLRSNDRSLPRNWTWQYCGGTTIAKNNQSAQSMNSPVWNVITDGSVIADHSDIMGEALHAFFRQLYLDLSQ